MGICDQMEDPSTSRRIENLLPLGRAVAQALPEGIGVGDEIGAAVRDAPSATAFRAGASRSAPPPRRPRNGRVTSGARCETVALRVLWKRIEERRCGCAADEALG